MKIHIFYSHYNVSGTDSKFRPNWFDYEKCFINLLNTTKNKNVDIHVVMDGKIEDNWIKKYKDKYTTHEIEAGNGSDAFIKIFEIILNLNTIGDKDLIYILENDYLHTDDWVDKVSDIFETFSGLSYVSLYDAIDKYSAPMYDDLISKILVTNTSHWRTTPSTCGSFVTTKNILIEDYDEQTGKTIPPGDHHKWVWLNENKGRFVLILIFGLSTHCMDFLMSPIIDWKKINENAIIHK
jgi:predicted SnoaL-like aldol condensation-catalyzing enzyme